VVLARRLDLGHEMTQVEGWAARVGEGAPGAGHLAHGLAAELAAAAAELPAAPEVPVHKDFHAGHVLVGDGPAGDPVHRGIVVIDLDEARMGDPALDVAHLISYLDLSPWAGAPAAREAFLAGYGPLPGPAAEARLAFFAAHTHLKIAKQLVAGRGPLPAPPAGWRTAALTAVLRKGLACLGG
jgi:aminoglycoside phosphotransferase (APT) family kinase protein